MTQEQNFHIATVGWGRGRIERLWDPIVTGTGFRFSHILPPSYVREEWPSLSSRKDTYFLRERLREGMPPPDVSMLAALEAADLPTIHTMIMGDRVVSKIRYDDALAYATFLALKFRELFERIAPDVIIGGFDAIHGSMALAVARHMGIPWFAMNFSVIPPGLVCFCDRMSPTARVHLQRRPEGELRTLAERSLSRFECREVQAPAYIAPPPLPLHRKLGRLPARVASVFRTIKRAQMREVLQFTESRPAHDVAAALRLLRRTSAARKAIERMPALAAPPRSPYVLFGLHFQPESSIDVWAPYFSNQMWVIELLARSIPPTHKLLVKIHKSDVANHSLERLTRMCSFAGVELVKPFADTRAFIDAADLIVSIQGTMGLEAALLGKPVIMLGESPVVMFPSATRIGEIWNLPELIRRQLAIARPSRNEIIDAYASYLSPFLPASHNDWRVKQNAQELDGYVALFYTLREYLDRGRQPLHEARA